MSATRAMEQTKQVELRNGPAHMKRIEVDPRSSGVVIPVLGADGFGQVTYRPTALRTNDGLEIWTPQDRVVH